jgi:DNA processing protein
MEYKEKIIKIRDFLNSSVGFEMYTICDVVILHLNLIHGIGPKTIEVLTHDYTLCDDDSINFYNVSLLQLNQTYNKLGLTNRILKTMCDGLCDFGILEREVELLVKNKVYFVTPLLEYYPHQLNFLDNKISVLYIKTNNIEEFKNKNKKNIACIGSRNANAYAKSSLAHCFCDIDDSMIRIISGGAIGGDAIAHELALEKKIVTWSIIGSGLCHWYPQTNYFLFKKIVESGGALLSPFCMETEPSKTTFPARNMIIAGMSDGILVMQAAKKSGTFITAQAGLEFGKNIGTIPGSLFDPLSHGGFDLIKQGASVISCSSDVLDLLNLQSEIKKNSIICEKENNKKNNSYCFTQDELTIISIIQEDLCTIDELVIKAKKEYEVISNIILDLKQKNYVETDIMGRVRIK